MTTTLPTPVVAPSPHARHRVRTRTSPAIPSRTATAALLANTASLVRRDHSITEAVRAAFSAIYQHPEALAAWATAVGYDGPRSGLFPAICLANSSAAAVAASLYKAARGAGA